MSSRCTGTRGSDPGCTGYLLTRQGCSFIHTAQCAPLGRECDDHAKQIRRLARCDAGGGLGAAHRLPAPAPGTPRPREGRARAVGPRGGAALRPEQHPVRDEHPHRRVGTGQERTLRPAPARRRPDPLGLRIGCAPPPAVRSVAAAGELPRRRCADARRDARRDGDPGPAGRADRARAARVRPRGRAARRRHGRPRHRRGARTRRRPRHRRVTGDARGAQDQDGRRDRAARPVGRARRRGLRGDLPDAATGRLRARDRRPCAPAPLRDGLGAGRGGQRRLGRPLQSASARLLRPASATGRSGVLRHHPLVHGLSNVLLPHVQRRQRQPGAARRVQAVPRVARRGDRARPARHDDRPDRRGLADGRRSSASPTRRRASASSSGTGSGSGSTSRR